MRVYPKCELFERFKNKMNNSEINKQSKKDIDLETYKIVKGVLHRRHHYVCFHIRAKKDFNMRWSGIEMYFKNEDSSSNILHEISHFQLCTKNRIKLPEYGLGDSPDGNTSFESFVSSQYSDLEESRSSTLGILWELSIKLNIEATLINHAWSGISGSDFLVNDGIAESNIKEFSRNLRYLYDHNLINNNLLPQFRTIRD